MNFTKKELADIETALSARYEQLKKSASARTVERGGSSPAAIARYADLLEKVRAALKG